MIIDETDNAEYFLYKYNLSNEENKKDYVPSGAGTNEKLRKIQEARGYFRDK